MGKLKWTGLSPGRNTPGSIPRRALVSEGDGGSDGKALEEEDRSVVLRLTCVYT